MTDDDGLVVVGRQDFEVSYNLSLTSSASSFTLYPRRAVLRGIGMLLPPRARSTPKARRHEHRTTGGAGGVAFRPGTCPVPSGRREDRWSARWLMEQMGYSAWQNFEPIIERAKGFNFNVRTLFTVDRKNTGGRPQTDRWRAPA